MNTDRFTSRLGKATAFPATPFYEGDPHQDLAEALGHDLQLHKAHVVMLAEQCIIPRDVARAIMRGLLDLEQRGIDSMALDPSLGLYLSTEKCLVDRLGPDVAGMMHTARSRNDLEPANNRLYVRDRIDRIVGALVELKSALLRQAEEHVETVMPGYTHHSQQAQPITFAHYLLASHDAFSRGGCEEGPGPCRECTHPERPGWSRPERGEENDRNEEGGVGAGPGAHGAENASSGAGGPDAP